MHWLTMTVLIIIAISNIFTLIKIGGLIMSNQEALANLTQAIVDLNATIDAIVPQEDSSVEIQAAADAVIAANAKLKEKV